MTNASTSGLGAAQSTTYVEQGALDRLKNIQNLTKRNWQGVAVDHSGRPGKIDFKFIFIGTANIVNKKRYHPVSELLLVTFKDLKNTGRRREIQNTVQDAWET